MQIKKPEKETEEVDAQRGAKILRAAFLKEELGQHYDAERAGDHLMSNSKVNT
jgi:hypothetical protein